MSCHVVDPGELLKALRAAYFGCWRMDFLMTKQVFTVNEACSAGCKTAWPRPQVVPDAVYPFHMSSVFNTSATALWGACMTILQPSVICQRSFTYMTINRLFWFFGKAFRLAFFADLLIIRVSQNRFVVDGIHWGLHAIEDFLFHIPFDEIWSNRSRGCRLLMAVGKLFVQVTVVWSPTVLPNTSRCWMSQQDRNSLHDECKLCVG